jgi:hypothetical protein
MEKVTTNDGKPTQDRRPTRSARHEASHELIQRSVIKRVECDYVIVHPGAQPQRDVDDLGNRSGRIPPNRQPLAQVGTSRVRKRTPCRAGMNRSHETTSK